MKMTDVNISIFLCFEEQTGLEPVTHNLGDL
jgi:hypothetical protein